MTEFKPPDYKPDRLDGQDLDPLADQKAIKLATILGIISLSLAFVAIVLASIGGSPVIINNLPNLPGVITTGNHLVFSTIWLWAKCCCSAYGTCRPYQLY